MSETLILANLTPNEFDELHKAEVLYCGSTEVHTLWGYPPTSRGLIPYMATFISQAGRAFETLRWKDPCVTEWQGIWCARRNHADCEGKEHYQKPKRT